MLKRIWKWYNSLTNRVKTSNSLSIAIVGLISTVMSVAGISLHDWTQNVWISILIIVIAFVIFSIAVYFVIGEIFKDSISMVIRKTSVSVCCGDIFETEGMKVIGCDTHFDTRVDDTVISKSSLHGKLVLKHGEKEEIKAVVEKEAHRLNLTANSDGLYDFPLGTIIRYDSSKDNKTYLMLAMTELDCNHESHTNMAKFEHMLMKMWSEISRVYARNDVILPLLGSGIARFDDGPKDKEDLLRCILCTLNASGVSLNSNVKVVLYGDAKDIPLYEYKDMFKLGQPK